MHWWRTECAHKSQIQNCHCLLGGRRGRLLLPSINCYFGCKWSSAGREVGGGGGAPCACATGIQHLLLLKEEWHGDTTNRRRGNNEMEKKKLSEKQQHTAAHSLQSPWTGEWIVCNTRPNIKISLDNCARPEPCKKHAGICDGKYETKLFQTEQARRGRGSVGRRPISDHFDGD